MEECLYSESGFYERGGGAAGVKHFVTAVTTSMGFRRAVYKNLEQFIAKNGPKVNVVDFGSGNADMLFSLKRLTKDLYPDLNWYAIEVSSTARINIEVLYPWINVLPKFEIENDLPCFIIANELFDNLVVELVKEDGSYTPELIGAKEIVQSLKNKKCEVLVADYFIDDEQIKEMGKHTPPKFIRGYRNQQIVETWYNYPGKCDVTVDVHKEQLVNIFEDNGFKLIEGKNQSEFVGNSEDEFFNHELFDVLTFSND